MEDKKVGWNLWELDRHHGEVWESRFQITSKNPTCSKISKTPNGWAVFREGIKPMWEDEQNCGRLTAKNVESFEMSKIIHSFFNAFANDKYVNGVLYTRTKNFALWLNNTMVTRGKVERSVTFYLKKKFSKICNREVNEIIFDDFQKSKDRNLHLTDIIWKYGQISAKNAVLINLPVYDMDIIKASPNFIINYERVFPLECIECFLIETTFFNPFDSEILIQKFVEGCFTAFQKGKKEKFNGISKAIALKIVENEITVRFYTDPEGYCKRDNVKHKIFFEVLILFAHEWKQQLLNEFLPSDVDLKISGYREKDYDLQFTI